MTRYKIKARPYYRGVNDRDNWRPAPILGIGSLGGGEESDMLRCALAGRGESRAKGHPFHYLNRNGRGGLIRACRANLLESRYLRPVRADGRLSDLGRDLPSVGRLH